MFVCLYQRILLTTESIWFSFKVKLLIGPGKVFNYLKVTLGTIQMKYNPPPLQKKYIFYIFFLRLFKLRMGDEAQFFQLTP